MKNMLTAVAIATALLSTACDKDESTSTPITEENIVGTWEVEKYTINGKADETNTDDYLQLNGTSFTSRFSLLDGYYYGTYTLSGERLSFAGNGETLGCTVEELSKGSMVLIDNIDGDEYKHYYRRVSSPTTYNVKNETTITSPSFFYSVADLMGDPLVSRHGLLGKGATCFQYVYCKRNNVRILVYITIGFTTYKWIMAYPVKLVKGKNTTVVLADTTSVLNVTNSLAPSLKSAGERATIKEMVDAIAH